MSVVAHAAAQRRPIAGTWSFFRLCCACSTTCFVPARTVCSLGDAAEEGVVPARKAVAAARPEAKIRIRM
ncbi:hypothetical protein Axi01nite_75260 [Actinoplanes xinjiangensis]|nr:hypothetical protein Axi01nite_75260 [Actinoplanes xinjiangensis]